MKIILKNIGVFRQAEDEPGELYETLGEYLDLRDVLDKSLQYKN